jgi:hypothetical protein
MKIPPAILILMMMTVTMPIYALSLGYTGYSLQQQQGEASVLDSIDVKNANLSLGKPFYTEKIEFPTNQNIQDSKNSSASTSSAYSFEGNGTLNNIQITASGSGNEVLREDGTNHLIGRALFTSSQNGSASYSFEAITNTTEEGIKTSLGAAFFDANATGNLESLSSIVGVYESYTDEDHGKGIFAMWLVNDLLSKK